MTRDARRVLFIAALMGLTAAAAAALSPAVVRNYASPDLDVMLPDTFGSWRRVQLSSMVLPQEVTLEAGEAVAYRAYQDDLGRTVTVVAAYGPPLGDSVRLHRPEACYAAQGFTVRAKRESTMRLGAGEVPLVELDTESAATREAVTYWLREGDAFSTGPSETGWRRIANGMSGPVDGALVRASTKNAQAPQFDLNKRFLSEFAAALKPDARRLLLGNEAAP